LGFGDTIAVLRARRLELSYTERMNFASIATIVTPSANTEQLLALIAAIVFAVAALVALGTRTYYAVLMAGGLAVLAAAILWS